MGTIEELQILRAELIREIDDKIGQTIEKLKAEQAGRRAAEPARPGRTYESCYPLHMETGIFKGKRPTAVIFSNGSRIGVPTWKMVYEEILKECNQDPEKHKRLMDLRGKLQGRNRVLLGSEEGKMRSPVKIDQALYAESHYDTETLLKILTTRILDEVGFDYSEIQIAVKND